MDDTFVKEGKLLRLVAEQYASQARFSKIFSYAPSITAETGKADNKYLAAIDNPNQPIHMYRYLFRVLLYFRVATADTLYRMLYALSQKEDIWIPFRVEDSASIFNDSRNKDSLQDFRKKLRKLRKDYNLLTLIEAKTAAGYTEADVKKGPFWHTEIDESGKEHSYLALPVVYAGNYNTYRLASKMSDFGPLRNYYDNYDVNTYSSAKISRMIASGFVASMFAVSSPENCDFQGLVGPQVSILNSYRPICEARVFAFDSALHYTVRNGNAAQTQVLYMLGAGFANDIKTYTKQDALDVVQFAVCGAMSAVRSTQPYRLLKNPQETYASKVCIVLQDFSQLDLFKEAFKLLHAYPETLKRIYFTTEVTVRLKDIDLDPVRLGLSGGSAENKEKLRRFNQAAATDLCFRFEADEDGELVLVRDNNLLGYCEPEKEKAEEED